ncbi:MarR family transcriptional regulator [Streptomyces roseoverticillatus]|uniref:MarR family transcriptional regulator n=1 Tax=Streptomyces roseoverticillatus TaxID=66429 RepID=UPI001F36DBA6|nr:helix-turn-helix domain-containing protein [Streptomyces roseoverticillatus]MCF3100951.1 MarR family transcriptional regulator [Streptomyces roseoverticillatus]
MPFDILPSVEVLLELYYGEKLDQVQIAEKFGVSKQAVSAAMSGYMTKTPAEKVASLIPWEMADGAHHRKYESKRVKALMRRRMMDTTLSVQQRKWAAGIAQKLQDHVLLYDGKSPDGFKWDDRAASDGQFFFRWPQGVELPTAENDLSLIMIKLPAEEKKERLVLELAITKVDEGMDEEAAVKAAIAEVAEQG